MLVKNESNKSNASQRKMQIVDFLDIDTNKITFQTTKVKQIQWKSDWHII